MAMEKDMKNRIGENQTLCGYCGKACNDGCAWSERFDPVDGWNAVRTLNSYHVLDCPEFVSDVGKRRDAQSMDTEGCILLLKAVMRLMREDYISLAGARKPIERFIRNPNANNLFFFTTPEDVIRQLRKDAEEHDRKTAEAGRVRQPAQESVPDRV